HEVRTISHPERFLEGQGLGRSVRLQLEGGSDHDSRILPPSGCIEWVQLAPARAERNYRFSRATGGTTHMPEADYKVRDLSLAALGRKEIQLAEHEMPGLMALRSQHGGTKPLTGARITGSL